MSTFTITGPGQFRNGAGRVVRWRATAGTPGATTLYNGNAWGDQVKNPAFYDVLDTRTPVISTWNVFSGVTVGDSSSYTPVFGVYISQPAGQTSELETTD